MRSVKSMPWPPRPDLMGDNHVDLAKRLYNIMAWTIGVGDGSDDILWQEVKVKVIPKRHRKILSIGQDMVMVSSHAKTKFPHATELLSAPHTDTDEATRSTDGAPE